MYECSIVQLLKIMAKFGHGQIRANARYSYEYGSDTTDARLTKPLGLTTACAAARVTVRYSYCTVVEQ